MLSSELLQNKHSCHSSIRAIRDLMGGMTQYLSDKESEVSRLQAKSPDFALRLR
jgi:hypothetical protein